MASRKLARVLTWLASAAVLVIVCAFRPQTAYAAILPACENHPLTAMPAEWLPALPADMATDACVDSAASRGNGRDADDVRETGDARVAAMCDDRGASVVAPPRVLPVVDARIEAGSCSAVEVLGPSCAPGPNDSPLGLMAFAVIEQGALGDELMVPSASSELAPPYPAVEGAALRGVTRDIEHPPR